MEKLKLAAAERAIGLIENHKIIGVGSGSTVQCFIALLAQHKGQIEGCVAASIETEAALKAHGLPVLDLNVAGPLTLYIDGADEVNELKEAIKGGGAALAREKVLASAAKTWVCIVDESKLVKRLGQKPVPVEVLPMARSFVAREIVKLGGDPVYREGVITDNQNCILDVYHLGLEQPIAMENQLKAIPGVLENGLFANRAADSLIVAGTQGVRDF